MIEKGGEKISKIAGGGKEADCISGEDLVLADREFCPPEQAPTGTAKPK